MQETQPKPRNKELTSTQLQKLRKIPQYLGINSRQFVLYNLVQKQSNSGLFKNQRLLILNAKKQYLCYLSQVPPLLIPFQNELEVSTQQSKQKLTTNYTYQNGENKFTCKIIPDKNGIEIKVIKMDKKVEWIYYFFNKELMEEWFGHISFMFTKSRQEIDQRYHIKQQPKQIKERPEVSIQQEYTPVKINQELLPQKNEQINSRLKQSHHKSEGLKDINSRVVIQQIKPASKDQKQSQYNQFSQNSPLGQFVRQDRRYHTQQGSINNKEGRLYYTTPINEQSNENINAKQSNIKKSTRKIYNSKQFQSKHNDLPMSFRKNPNNHKQTNWNELYYSRNDSKSKVYFDFINQCIKYVRKLVDQLPVTKSIQNIQRIQQYFHTNSNGIIYKIAYGKQQNSLIYELQNNNPIVCDNYDNYDDLKTQFFQQKQQFFKNTEQQPPLISFIQYKGLSFLCRASKDEHSITKSYKSFKRSNLNQDSLLKKMQNLQLFIVSSYDLQTIMRYLNASTLNWSYLYHQTQVKQFKLQFLNQMFSEVFINIVKGQLFHLYKSSIFDQLSQMSHEVIQQAVCDSVLILVNRLFGKGKQSDRLWQIIIQEVQRKYKIPSTTQNILPGYLLYSVIFKLGIQIKKNISMKTTFILFKKNKAIERQYVLGFNPKVYCLVYEQMSTLLHQIKENLQSSNQNNQQLEMFINNEQFQHIPQSINYLIPKINIQLSKTHPYDSKGDSVLIYESLISDIPTQYNYQIVLSAISWLLEAQRHDQAFDLAFIKIQQLIFWTGKVPINSLIYDSFAEYFIQHDSVEKAIQQLKLSIKTLSEIFGPNDDKLLRKKYDISGLYLALNRKDESLKELTQCKFLCESNKYEQSSLYVKILMKMAKLNLSMSKYSESVALSMICLKKLQLKGQDQHVFQSQTAACEFLDVGELLLRSFQLSNRRDQLFEVLSLCTERCQNVNSIKAYKRLFRIILFPYLKRLSLKQSQIYMMIVQELSTAYKQSSLTQEDLYENIRGKKMLVQIDQKMKNEFKNIVKMHEELIKKKVLQEYLYNQQEILSKLDKTEVQQFLKGTFLITNLIGIGFIQGMLKDIYYD